MPVSPFIGTFPGAGGSFPMAGVRPKARKRQVFASSGTWVAPATVTEIRLTMVGGGGGGAGGAGVTGFAYGSQNPDNYTYSNFNSGGGGSGGNTIIEAIIPVIPSTIYTITIGAGGSGGAVGLSGNYVGSTPLKGNNGGNTSFVGGTTYLLVSGGSAGANYLNVNQNSAPASYASFTPTLNQGYSTLLNNSDYSVKNMLVVSSSGGSVQSVGQSAIIIGASGSVGAGPAAYTNATSVVYNTAYTASSGYSCQQVPGGQQGNLATTNGNSYRATYPGGGGGASLLGPGGQGASAGIWNIFSGAPPTAAGIVSASVLGLSGSQLYSLPSYGAGGGGGAGSLNIMYTDTSGFIGPAGTTYFYDMSGSAGGNGISGVVIVSWEE